MLFGCVLLQIQNGHSIDIKFLEKTCEYEISSHTNWCIKQYSILLVKIQHQTGINSRYPEAIIQS